MIAGPAESETIPTADCSSGRVYPAKAVCDVGGHYSRPDNFQLCVNRAPYRRVVDMAGSDKQPVEALADWALS